MCIVLANITFVSDVVFGSSLTELCKRERENVPRFVQECVMAVENRGNMLFSAIKSFTTNTFYIL